jgi:hypothetical protein
MYQPTVARRAFGFPRVLYLVEDTHEWCCPPDAHPDSRITDESIVQLQNVLNTFVFGGRLEIGLDIKHFDPFDDEVWEFRSYAAKPYLRVLGSFALPRYFIGVVHRVRDDLEDLRGGPKWRKAIRETIEMRDDILDGTLPFSGNVFGDYV